MNKPASQQTETRTYAATEVRMVEDANGVPTQIVGYAAVFNAISEDLGGFREIVKPGAFTRTLAGNPDVRLLINHGGLALARTASGTLQLTQDDKGLRFTANIDPNDPDVKSLAPKMKRGDVNQCSFAFTTKADDWRSENGQTIRDLQDVEINNGDVSLVTFPAYPQTAAAMRSLGRFNEQNKAAPAGTEKRVLTVIDDQSLIYRCRSAVQYCRYTFDALNSVLDELSDTDPAKMDDQDNEAAEDLVSALVDLIAKARRTKATLEATGAEDETENDTDDDEPQEPAPATSGNDATLAAAMLALAEAD